MTHKVATLIEAVADTLTGLATTGTNVEKSRGYAISATPAISVRLASVSPANELTNAFLDNSVDIETVFHVSGAELDLDNQVLQIDAEVYAALMADRTQGGAVIDTDPELLSVDSTADQETPTAIGVRKWRFFLRHSITSAEV